LLDYFKKLFGLSKPIYNELSAYLTALTCLILFFSHPNFRQEIHTLLDGSQSIKDTIGSFLIGLIAISGLSLSIFHVFSRREKSYVEKICMGIFAITANAIAAIEAGIEQLNSGDYILILFPLWNIIIGLIMLIQLRMGKYEITDENASLVEVAGISLVLLVVFALTYFTLNLSWAMTFSICMFYSSSIYFLVTWVINRYRSHPA
jgi:hypothetical protein